VLNGQATFMLPANPGDPPSHEDLARALNTIGAASIPPILGKKGNHLGFDEGPSSPPPRRIPCWLGRCEL
jgi:hypothetical protein